MKPQRHQLSVSLTDDCNLRCSYCTAPRRSARLSQATAEHLIALLERAQPAALDVNYHGGEPLLCWDRLVQLTQELRRIMGSRRVSFNLSTNGTELTPERARYLTDQGFSVRVSIDGRRSSHTLHRVTASRQVSAAQAAYDRTLRALGLLRAAGARLGANLVVTPATVDELLPNAAFLIDQGVCQLSVSPAIGVVWPGEHLLCLDRQLAGLAALWRPWLDLHPKAEHEDLRRSVAWEIQRAAYVLGRQVNLPDAVVLVVGPTGKIFSDEPDALTEDLLALGQLHDITSLAELPAPGPTVFQLLSDRGLYGPQLLQSLRRSHRILARRLAELQRELFGPAA